MRAKSAKRVSMKNSTEAHGVGDEAIPQASRQTTSEVDGSTDLAQAVVLLNPQSVVPSPWANRHRRSFMGADFERLKASISAARVNFQSIKVRPVPLAGAIADRPPNAFEIVFGHRRHRACIELVLPVPAVIAPLSDRELFAEMDQENRTHKPLSSFDQGGMFRQALDTGLYPSAKALAEELDANPSLVSKSISIARLPPEVIQAFVSPLEIQYRWAGPLRDAHSKTPDALITRARLLQIDQARMPVRPPMLTSHDGRLFAGFPMAALRCPPKGAPVRLAEFRRLRICAAPCNGYSQRKALDATERQKHQP